LSDLRILEKLPYALGLGIGSISFQLFTYSRLKVPWNQLSIILPWIIIFAYLFYVERQKIHFIKLHFKGKFSKLDNFFGILLVVVIFYTGFEAWLRPLSAWDAWAIWLLKAKMFFVDGFVNPHVYHLLKDSYPYVINLAATFIYIILGKVDDRAVLLLFFSFYLMLGLTFFSFSRQRFGVFSALLFTFLLLSIQNLIRHGGRFEAGYADLALGFYIFTAEKLRFIKSNRRMGFIYRCG
jgi:hypothetical protein